VRVSHEQDAALFQRSSMFVQLYKAYGTNRTRYKRDGPFVAPPASR
jgi:hypothetical protein